MGNMETPINPSFIADGSPVFRTEQQFQAACVEWYWNRFHEFRKCLHCNNNNSATARAGNVAKALGVVAGVSDLEMIGWREMWFIELKLPGEKQGKEQMEFEAQVKRAGHNYIVIRTLNEFKTLLCQIIGRYSQAGV